MTVVRSAVALRQLYERYRSAPKLKSSTRRPGEWLIVEQGTSDAKLFEDALGTSPASDNAETVVRELGPLNGTLLVHHERDVRLVAQRVATRSRKLELRFVLVPHGKSTKGSKPTPRGDLPAVIGQLNLDQVGPQKVDVHEKVDVHAKRSTYHGSVDENGGSNVSDVSDGAVLLLPDGTPIPDLSNLLTEHELVELWENGKLNDTDALDVLFADYEKLISEAIESDEEIDFGSMAERFLARATLASGTPPIETSEAHPRDTWERISADVVSWTKRTVHSLRDGDARGHLIVLAPSPGTGKSRGMMEAADQEQNAKRTVGYAVLSRAQLNETAERLRSTNPQIRLIVIEGRDNKNCHNFDQVTVATDAGYAPGSAVCPSCEFYPQPGKRFSHFSKSSDICPYYQTRLTAVLDRKLSDPNRGYLRQAPAIILTTHAAAIQGSHIATRRNQNFWNFDTLFIDEDPTAAMVTQHEISEQALTYHQVDGHGNLDGPTRGTRLLRDAMREAIRLREQAAGRGFVDVNGDPDREHDREHGSTFAGSALHALLESVALSSQSLNLRAIGSMTIDGMTNGPPKGEIMNLTPDEVAKRYPNRYLSPLFAILEEEAVAMAEARAAGISLEPAYRVHLDIIRDEDKWRPVLRVHELRGYANGRTNIVVGDAYADVAHYEGLFGRHRRDGKVQAIQHRAVWPTTSTLVRIVTRASTKHIRLTTQLHDHLDTKVRPVLELERGRRIVFYVHKAMKGDLRDWLEKYNDELDLGEYAIEHWGSGRGKDTYRDFDTFIAVTEYVPNVGALTHEANTVAALASPSNTRVAHWTYGAIRTKGSASFASSLGGASPFYQAAFHRKATDELAQAVHRIRPAIASPSGRQKRAYVFGHQVPWTDELIAATAATAVVDHGHDEVDLETEALGRGARFSLTETLGLLSEREVAGAIAEVFKTLGCWGHCFAHSLLGVPAWASIENLVVGGSSSGDERGVSIREKKIVGAPRSHLVVRVRTPPSAWSAISDRIRRNSRIYMAGLERFASSLTFPSRRHRAEWMSPTSHGIDFWGDLSEFSRILAECYAPTKVPF